MKIINLLIINLFAVSLISSCNSKKPSQSEESTDTLSMVSEKSEVIQPLYATEQVLYDTDDPAIWVNPDSPQESLIVGTDKGGDTGEGGLYVFNLDGTIDTTKSIIGVGRPNNVDIEYGLKLGGESVDIAVAAERVQNRLLIYSLPDMKPLTDNGIEVFKGESERAPMGISLYKRPADGAVFAIVGRKSGPKEGYLWQYLLEDDGSGKVKATLVRKFGAWSGVKEIEAIAVDDQLGYVYYSDEQVGVRKYYADPAMDNNDELAFFAKEGFADDHEGISIYQETDSTGYVIVSDQGANQFHMFPREGSDNDPHSHPLVKTVKLSTQSSDGSEVTSADLGGRFPNGMFVAMSEDKTFQVYSWDQLIESENLAEVE